MSMTSRKTRELLLFLALLLAWGEAVAAPWLASGHQHDGTMQQTSVSAQLHIAGGNTVSAVHPLGHAHATDHGDMHVDSAAAAPATPIVHQSHPATDCDGTCAFCRGMNLSDVVAPLGVGTPLLLPWRAPLLSLTVAVPPPTSHYRPPAVG